MQRVASWVFDSASLGDYMFVPGCLTEGVTLLVGLLYMYLTLLSKIKEGVASENFSPIENRTKVPWL